MQMKKYRSERMQEFMQQPGEFYLAFIPFSMGLMPIVFAIIGELSWETIWPTTGSLIFIALLVGGIPWMQVVLADKRDRQNTVSKI